MRNEHWAIGIDLGGTKTALAAVNESGHILSKELYPTEVEKGSDWVMATLTQKIQIFLHQSDRLPQAIGIGLAGQIAPSGKEIIFAPNLGWHHLPFVSILQQTFSLPIVLLNDVRAATWGEWKYGAGRGEKDLVTLFIGTGIGGGVITGGSLMLGANNCAGELGHMTLKMDGPRCTCGNRGCLEALASGWAIAQQAQELLKNNREAQTPLWQVCQGKISQITARHVLEAASSGDSLSQLIVEEAISALIAGCTSLVNAFNPARLIIGGGVGTHLPHLIARIQNEIRALNAARQRFQVVPALLKEEAGIIGAASFALENYK